jgi:hypothetical protein
LPRRIDICTVRVPRPAMAAARQGEQFIWIGPLVLRHLKQRQVVALTRQPDHRVVGSMPGHVPAHDRIGAAPRGHDAGLQIAPSSVAQLRGGDPGAG